MQKINVEEINEAPWEAGSGAFRGFGKDVSEELGRDPDSLDLSKRHPFDLEIQRIPPGYGSFQLHAHSAQWEMYVVISGSGFVREEFGSTPIERGDAFIFKPGEAHQINNDGVEDLVLYCIADNPIGEHVWMPDGNKWVVRIPERRVLSADSA